MKNFGFRDLVLVDPRLHRHTDPNGGEGVFERESRQMAWGALDVLEDARRVETLEDALEGCGTALGTAPNPIQRVRNYRPEEGIDLLLPDSEPPSALIFGSESSGLTREEVSLLSGVIVIPTDPAHRDLNLAQSVVLLAYLLFVKRTEPPPPKVPSPAPHEEVEAAVSGLLDLALEAGFLQERELPVSRELRSMLHRAGLSRREADLLRGLWRKIGYLVDRQR
jgi:TrmH family RNA methyltransferase